MHFEVFLGGLTMLVGSCVIVCVCKNCKKRNAQKRMSKNCPRRPPSISLVVDEKKDTAAYINSIRILESPMLVTKICPSEDETSKSRTSSKDSCDSSRGLLGQKDWNQSSPTWIGTPSFKEEWTKRSEQIRVIPTIYIESVPASVA